MTFLWPIRDEGGTLLTRIHSSVDRCSPVAATSLNQDFFVSVSPEKGSPFPLCPTGIKFVFFLSAELLSS